MSEKTLGAGVFPSITLSKIKDFITLTKPCCTSVRISECHVAKVSEFHNIIIL